MTPEQNKAIVVRFNRECIEQGKMDSFTELLAEDVVNHTAVPGAPPGREGFIYFLQNVLRTGLADVKVDILEQVAERDLVVTRKQIRGTHKGPLLGIPPTGRSVAINIIDIIRIRDGKYQEHWGISNFSEVVAQLSKT